MAITCDVGTARDVVNTPTFNDLSQSREMGRLREWIVEISKKVNAHQAALVCFKTQVNSEIARLDADIALLATAADVTTLTARVTALEAQTTALDGHDHEILVGTAIGGDAVMFSGGVDGTLDAPTGAGGNARTEVFDIP